MSLSDFITSETEYVAALRVLCDHYSKPLKESLSTSSPVLSEEEYSCLFEEIVLLKDSHESFLSALGSTSLLDSSGEFGDAWDNLLSDELISVYTHYLESSFAKYALLLRLRTVMMNKDESSGDDKISDWMRLTHSVASLSSSSSSPTTEASIRACQMSIEKLLSLPLTRLIHYEMWLNQLIDGSSGISFENVTKLQKCVDLLSEKNSNKLRLIIQRLVDAMITDAIMKKMKNMPSELWDSSVPESVKGAEDSDLDDVLMGRQCWSEQRVLLYSGFLYKIGRKGKRDEYLFYLFDDCLIYGSVSQSSAAIIARGRSLTDAQTSRRSSRSGGTPGRGGVTVPDMTRSSTFEEEPEALDFNYQDFLNAGAGRMTVPTAELFIDSTPEAGEDGLVSPIITHESTDHFGMVKVPLGDVVFPAVKTDNILEFGVSLSCELELMSSIAAAASVDGGSPPTGTIYDSTSSVGGGTSATIARPPALRTHAGPLSSEMVPDMKFHNAMVMDAAFKVKPYEFGTMRPKSNCFQVYSKTKSFIIECPNEMSKHLWFSALRKCELRNKDSVSEDTVMERAECSAPLYIPSEWSMNCMKCGKSFNSMTRRKKCCHHCGSLVCKKCMAANKLPLLHTEDYEQGQSESMLCSVCNDCFKSNLNKFKDLDPTTGSSTMMMKRRLKLGVRSSGKKKKSSGKKRGSQGNEASDEEDWGTDDDSVDDDVDDGGKGLRTARGVVRGSFVKLRQSRGGRKAGGDRGGGSGLKKSGGGGKVFSTLRVARAKERRVQQDDSGSEGSDSSDFEPSVEQRNSDRFENGIPTFTTRISLSSEGGGRSPPLGALTPPSTTLNSSLLKSPGSVHGSKGHFGHLDSFDQSGLAFAEDELEPSDYASSPKRLVPPPSELGTPSRVKHTHLRKSSKLTGYGSTVIIETATEIKLPGKPGLDSPTATVIASASSASALALAASSDNLRVLNESRHEISRSLNIKLGSRPVASDLVFQGVMYHTEYTDDNTNDYLKRLKESSRSLLERRLDDSFRPSEDEMKGRGILVDENESLSSVFAKRRRQSAMKKHLVMRPKPGELVAKHLLPPNSETVTNSLIGMSSPTSSDKGDDDSGDGPDISLAQLRYQLEFEKIHNEKLDKVFKMLMQARHLSLDTISRDLVNQLEEHLGGLQMGAMMEEFEILGYQLDDAHLALIDAETDLQMVDDEFKAAVSKGAAGLSAPTTVMSLHPYSMTPISSPVASPKAADSDSIADSQATLAELDASIAAITRQKIELAEQLASAMDRWRDLIRHPT